MFSQGRLLVGAMALLVVLLLFFAVRSCTDQSQQRKLEQRQTDAVVESAQDASNTQAGVAANDVATQDLDRQNEKDIRNAEGSDAAVGNDAHAAGLRALCSRKAYRDRPECRVQ